jgi:transcriptional regulator with XRE-family HTH domain
VRELRRRLGLTQGGLGRRVGVGQGVVGAWELERTMPRAATQGRLAELGPPPEGVAVRSALAHLYERRRALAAAKREALAEVRALRVRHRPSTEASVYPGGAVPQQAAFAAALAADQARLAAELAPLEARLAEIGRE